MTLGKFPLDGNGWQTVEFPFPSEFANHKWVTVYIDAYFKYSSQYALFSNYEVRGGVSGVKDIYVEDGCLRPAQGSILAEGLNGKTIGVYSLDGRNVWIGKCNSDRFEIPVASGIYIVGVGDKTVKIAVR